MKKKLATIKNIAIGICIASLFFVLISAKSPLPGTAKKYEALTAESKSELNSDVNSYMKKGWQPLGGVSMAYNKNGSARFSQAMVK